MTDMSIEALTFERNRTRILNALKNEGVTTVAELAQMSERELLTFRNMGRGSVRSIQQAIARVGEKAA